MKNTKLFALLLSATMLFSLLSACGGGAAKVRDDVSIPDLASSIDAALANDGRLADAGDSYIKSAMKMDISAYAGYNVKINSKGANVDEYGIFKGADSAHTATIEEDVKTYLAFRVESWTPAYMPEEYPKLENAQIKVVGNYVMYAILSDDERATAFTAMDAALAIK